MQTALLRTLFVLSASLGGLTSASASDMLIQARGTVSIDQYTNGAYAAAQIGSSVEFRFRVRLDGSPAVPDQLVRYEVLSPSFQVWIDGIVLPGAPTGSANFEVKNGLFGQDSLSITNLLDNGEGFAFDLEGDEDWISSTALPDLLGYHRQTDPLFNRVMQLTGSGGILFMDLEEVVIGPEVAFSAFCDPLPNSSGLPCLLAGTWQPYVGGGVHVSVTQGPPGEFGYCLIGSSFDPTGIQISQGRLCLQTQAPHALGRYNILGTDRNSLGVFDAQGVLQNQVGTSLSGDGFDVPTTLPLIGSPTLQAGQTWHFQFWFRESVSGVTNFSNGLSASW